MVKTKFDNSEILTDREIARTKTAILIRKYSLLGGYHVD